MVPRRRWAHGDQERPVRASGVLRFGQKVAGKAGTKKPASLQAFL
jgi:hypothetical protein